MDSFLNNNANKRSRSDEVSSLPPVSKKPRPSAMQGNVTAAVRVAEFGKKENFHCRWWEAVLSFLVVEVHLGKYQLILSVIVGRIKYLL